MVLYGHPQPGFEIFEAAYYYVLLAKLESYFHRVIKNIALHMTVKALCFKIYFPSWSVRLKKYSKIGVKIVYFKTYALYITNIYKPL